MSPLPFFDTLEAPALLTPLTSSAEQKKPNSKKIDS